MRLALLLALLLMVPLAGCFGEKSSPVRVAAFSPINDAQPGRWTDYAFRLESTNSFKQTLAVRAQPPEGWEWEADPREVTMAGKSTASVVVRMRPDANATYEPTDVDVFVGDTRSRVIVDVHDLGETPLAAGMGARIYLSLWWENGTLASTNDPALRNRTGIGPAVLEGENASYAPRKVYVGHASNDPIPDAFLAAGYEAAPPGIAERLLDAGDGAGMRAGETLHVELADAGAPAHALVRVLSVDEDPRT